MIAEGSRHDVSLVDDTLDASFTDEVSPLLIGDKAFDDQLQRAASSITLNIAEGAGEFSGAEKARFYRIAKRSATECAAILDLAKRRASISQDHFAQGRSLLLRIVGMLVKLVRSHG